MNIFETNYAAQVRFTITSNLLQ